MPTSVATTLSEDLEKGRGDRIDKAIERAMQELTRAARMGRDDTEEALSRASVALGEAAHSLAVDVRKRSTELAVATTREVRDHPVLTGAILAGAFAAMAGLLFALLPSARHFED